MWAWLFGPPDKTPDEALEEWRATTQAQIREIQRKTRELQRQMDHFASMAKKEPAQARVYAKEILFARKEFERLYEARSNLKAMELQLIDCAMKTKMAQHMQVSAGVAAAMNKLVSVPAISNVMRTMAAEMIRMGLVEEIMTPADDSDVQTAAEEEVNAVLEELTGKIKLPSVRTKGKTADAAPTQAPAAMKMTQ